MKALFVLALFAPAALAITIEPDNYAPGTDVSNAVEGVTLSTFAKASGFINPYFAPVFVRENALCQTSTLLCDAFTGSRAFSPHGDGFGSLDTWQSENGGPWLCLADPSRCASNPASFSVMLMTFDGPTNFVEITGASAQSFGVELLVFDAAFNILSQGSIVLEPFGGGDEVYLRSTSSYYSPTENVKYAMAWGWGFTSVDRIRFNSVPEPGTLALLGLGLAGLALGRKRIPHGESLPGA